MMSNDTELLIISNHFRKILTNGNVMMVKYAHSLTHTLRFCAGRMYRGDLRDFDKLYGEFPCFEEKKKKNNEKKRRNQPANKHYCYIKMRWTKRFDVAADMPTRLYRNICTNLNVCVCEAEFLNE